MALSSLSPASHARTHTHLNRYATIQLWLCVRVFCAISFCGCVCAIQLTSPPKRWRCARRASAGIFEEEWKNCSALKMILTVWLAVTRSTKHPNARGPWSRISIAPNRSSDVDFYWVVLLLLLLCNKWINKWNLVSLPKRRKRISSAIVHNNVDGCRFVSALLHRIRRMDFNSINVTHEFAY